MDVKTVGIVPNDLVSEIFGQVTLYDFAGHREFYSGHITKSMTVQPNWLKYSTCKVKLEPKSYRTFISIGFSPHRLGVVGSNHHSASFTTTHSG